MADEPEIEEARTGFTADGHKSFVHGHLSTAGFFCIALGAGFRVNWVLNLG